MRGGTIEEFDHAVHLTGARHNHITHLKATRSGDTNIGRAILLDSGSDDDLIDGNDASFNGRSGVAVLDSSRNVITRNRTNHNDVAGMGVFGGADNQVTANVMTAQRRKRHLLGSGHTGGRLAVNLIARNPEAGILMDSADEAAVTLNRLDGNGDNMVVFGNRNQVTANVISDAAGCDGGCGFNITVEGGTGNQVTANLVLGGAHDGIRLDSFAPDDLPLTDTLVRANIVRGAAIDGISLGTADRQRDPGRAHRGQPGERKRRRRHRRAPPRHAATRQHRKPQRRSRHQRRHGRDRRRRQPRGW